MTLAGHTGPATRESEQAEQLEQAEQPELAAVRDECVAAYGTDLVAYLLGAGEAGPLRAWRLADAAATRIGELRLRAAHAVLTQFKDPVHARAWLRRANAALGGRPPAAVLRTASTRRALLPVIEAAELPT